VPWWWDPELRISESKTFVDGVAVLNIFLKGKCYSETPFSLTSI